MGEPARGYRWRDFEPGETTGTATRFQEGHTLSTRHGANSSRLLQPIVDELLEWAAEALPWAMAPAFAPTLYAWAWAEARCELYRCYFDERGHHDDDGEPLAGLDRWDRVETRAENLRTQLGIGPMALAKLLGSLGSIDGPAAQEGLEALKATGAQLREAAERRALSPVPPEVDEHDAEHQHGDDEGGDRDR